MLLSPGEISKRLERILPTVTKPGRYVGGEYNQVVKDWENIGVHVALAFPDIYDIGVPNLGIAILYDTINQRSDCLAERVYLPWLDMEEALRQHQIPLFSLETKHALADFDIIGVTLPYETLYTNFLNLLDMAQIPLHTSERLKHHPLIIAGGHSAYNPEPMADFVDAFVIGEGEEIIHEIIDRYHSWKATGEDRNLLLKKIAQIPGVYVPSFYEASYNPDGTLAATTPLDASIHKTVTKRIVGTLPPPPTRFIVPSIEVVHNRVSVEIMRGCTRGCRFCHAGFVNRPVRERPVEQIVQAVQTALRQTGFEEVALLSLSSSDYTHIGELIDRVSSQTDFQNLVISLPSLRIESFSIDLMEKLRGSRQGGFTLAPEAATDRMRSIINKPIQSEQLIETTKAIYARGWTTIKLYFMIGHPSETLEDVQEIANLCQRVIAEGRRVIGRRASLNVGVSTFVPKPHTPFQWVSCDTPDMINAKQQVLRNGLRGPGLKFNWTDARETMLEAWLSRGDRRLGAVIETAWKLGAKFDAWQDQFNVQAWQMAFEQTGLDPDFYTHRPRSAEEIFPWDHISTGVKKSYLLTEYQNSLTGITREDCRDQCYACGILPMFNITRAKNPGSAWKCPEVTSPIITTK